MPQVPTTDQVFNNQNAIGANLNDTIIINKDILVAATAGVANNGIEGTTGVTIQNFGTIESAESEAILLTNNNSIINTGLISGTTGVHFNSSGLNINLLTNTGTISGLGFGGIAIQGGSALEAIVNSGTIVGSVLLGDGTDSFDGRGGHVVFGFVDLGAGNDVGIGGDFGDGFSGGDGNDTVKGNGGNDSFGASGSADDGNDLFDGGDGTDEYSALNAVDKVTINLEEGVAFGTSIGRDTLINVEDATGSHLDDFIFGNAGANTLFGSGGLDTMSGGAGNDTISGDAGNDIITGGAGADFLTGGADNDTFDYNKLSESGVTAASLATRSSISCTATTGSISLRLMPLRA
jgi:Ca2+-binding RTX toxin-like protein